MKLTRRQFGQSAVALGLTATLGTPARSADLTKVRFATDWLAQGAHGGYYQALADGTYAKAGLDVDIIQGGPQVNSRPLLAAGKVDFLMCGNLLLPFDDVRNGLPVKVVAAHFQKDPQVFMAHKGAYKGFDDLVNAPKILLSKDGQFSYWKWLVAAKGFKDEQVGPYNYSLAPFLADPKMVQQGYAVSEPLQAKKEGAEVDAWLLADHGWETYSCMVETTDAMIKDKPDVIQRFLDASAIGWYNYIYGDNSKAQAAINKANPDESLENLKWEAEQLKALGIVDAGDTEGKGIGAMTDERLKKFLDLCVNAKILDAGSVDLAKVADLSFVNKGTGLDVRKKLTGK